MTECHTMSLRTSAFDKVLVYRTWVSVAAMASVGSSSLSAPNPEFSDPLSSLSTPGARALHDGIDFSELYVIVCLDVCCSCSSCGIDCHGQLPTQIHHISYSECTGDCLGFVLPPTLIRLKSGQHSPKDSSKTGI